MENNAPKDEGGDRVLRGWLRAKIGRQHCATIRILPLRSCARTQTGERIRVFYWNSAAS